VGRTLNALRKVSGRSLRVGLAALTILICLVAVQPAAHAAIVICQGSTYLFDGFYSDPNPQTGIEGVSGDIRIENGQLCVMGSGYYNTTSEWVMIESPHAGGLAQVGVWRTYNMPYSSGPQYFYEGGATNAGSPVGWHNGTPAGVTHRFWVDWVQNGCPSGLASCFSFNVDTTRIGMSQFDPYVAWGSPNNLSTVWNMQFFGEVHDASSDIMGTNAGGSATVWSNLQAQNWVTNNYRNFTCDLTPANDQPSRYGMDSPDGGCGSWSTYTRT
jgi:hypothetical protein